jgi:tetratricopeptide (TPR) repeat protein
VTASSILVPDGAHRRISRRPSRTAAGLAAAALAVALASAGCLAHLRNAKAAITEAQELGRSYRTDASLAAYKRARAEAALEARSRPSAQAFTIKGMAEVNLGLWKDAESSFVKAFGLGFESGEEWAADVSLLGLAVSFEELGFRDQAFRVYENLTTKSRFRPVKLAAAERYVGLGLARARVLGEAEKKRALSTLLAAVDRLETADFANGAYHYYHAQVESHRGEWRRSYEEAVMARELGLPSEKILRDNDNQIVFCYDRLAGALPTGERGAFEAAHAGWTKKWQWADARTPGWKKSPAKE